MIGKIILGICILLAVCVYVNPSLSTMIAGAALFALSILGWVLLAILVIVGIIILIALFS
jgi:hypothetical protein